MVEAKIQTPSKRDDEAIFVTADVSRSLSNRKVQITILIIKFTIFIEFINKDINYKVIKVLAGQSDVFRELSYYITVISIPN